jgi:hypothetical protein
MGCMVTRPGLARHSYSSGYPPARVTVDAVTAAAPNAGGGGQTVYPLSAPLASFAADGAPYYNSGYLPGYPSRPVGGVVSLSLPPRAAMVDLSDTTSWDRPVIWPGAV